MADIAATGPDIPALREQLAVLVSTGKAKEAIGVQLTHEQVKRLSDKDVQKNAKRYQAHVGSKTTDSLVDGLLFLFTKLVGRVVPIKNINAYKKEIKDDYIINQKLSNLSGRTALKCGRGLTVANAAIITAKHIDFDELHLPWGETPSGDPDVWDGRPVTRALPSRDAEGYPLEGQDEVPE